MHRLGRLHRLAERRIVGRHVAPAEQGKALARDRLDPDIADDLPPVGVARHEQLADGVVAGRGQGEADLGGLLGEKFVRDLHQDAGAVAHARIGADRAAMLEIAEDAQAVFDGLVRLAALDVGDETDAAGIFLQRRVVEPVRGRHSGIGGVAQQVTVTRLRRRPASDHPFAVTLLVHATLAAN